jgi:hypothetical protein
MSTAKGDAVINVPQPTDASNVNPVHAGADAKLYDSAYGASGQIGKAPADGGGNTATPGDLSGNKNVFPLMHPGLSNLGDLLSPLLNPEGPQKWQGGDLSGNKNVFPLMHPGLSKLGDVLSSLPNPEGPQKWQGDDLQATATPLGKPERLSTGDTEIHEKDRDIIVMPKDEGSLVINKDGTYDLQLNKNSKEKAEVTQKDGVTTITFQPSGDKIQFDKDGLLDINRGNQGITWLRFDAMSFFGGIQLPPGSLQPIDKGGSAPDQGTPPHHKFPPIYEHTEASDASGQQTQN